MSKQKRGCKRKDIIKAYLIIVNLILMSFAFAYLVGAEDGGAENVVTKKEIAAETVEQYSQTQQASKPISPNLAQATLGTGVTTTTSYTKGTEVLYTTENGQQMIGKITNMAEDKTLSVTTNIGGGQTSTTTGLNPSEIKSLTKLNLQEAEIKKLGDFRSVYKSGEEYIGEATNGQTEIFTEAQLKNKGIDATKLTETTSKSLEQTTLSKLFGATQGNFMDAALSGVQYAFIWYGIGYTIGSMIGMDKKQTSAVSTSLAAGAFTYEMLFRWDKIDISKGLWAKPGEKGLFDMIGLKGGPGALGTGIIVSAVVFAIMYKKESKEIVTFSCKPWQAPTGSKGGNDCEKCNLQDGCSEYRCKSLGQACQLLNVGTEDEKCAWVNPKDTTSPSISMWEDVLTKGYKYEPDSAIRPPARGVKILKTSGDKCVKAFTPLEFGIITDEPAQCKIDYNHTLKFGDMAFWFGESNLFLYNHSQKLILPSPSAIEAVAPELQHNGTYTLYARCQDANENANVDEFAIRFCVEAGPDTTPPEIAGTSIANGMPVKFNQSNVELEVYVNEPAECKWSREDRSYEDLENSMSCNKNVWEMNNAFVYTCKTTLTGIKDRQENVFYFRCKDQPWANESDRNKNQQGYKFILIGTEPLNIIDIKPNGTLYGSTEVVSVWLEIETANGYENGDAVCYYAETKSGEDYIEFFDTGSSIHKQRLDLIEGDYKYYVKCIDLGGNRDDNETEFKVEVDREAPVVARVYRENELLKVITTEDSECRYSIQNCNFKFEDGIDMPYANQTSHVAEWKTENTYYIRCSDGYGNMPLPNKCSIIVRPYDVVEQKED